MHVVNLVDPFLGRMMRRVGATRNVVTEERLARVNLVALIQPLNRIISHRCGEIPTGLADVGVNGRRVAEQVWLSLAGVAADESVKVLKSHADGPQIKWTKLTGGEGWRVVSLAEPR